MVGYPNLFLLYCIFVCTVQAPRVAAFTACMQSLLVALFAASGFVVRVYVQVHMCCLNGGLFLFPSTFFFQIQEFGDFTWAKLTFFGKAYIGSESNHSINQSTNQFPFHIR